MPPKSQTALLEAVSGLSCYPDPECLELREAQANYHKVSPEQILVANGSIELIYLIPRLLTPRRALIFAPGFSEFENAVRLAGTGIILFHLAEERQFSFSLDELLPKLDGVELMFWCQPHNPTGYLLPSQDLSEILEVCRQRRIYLVVDEAFLEFVPRDIGQSLAARTGEFPHLIILRSMTKFYALAGLRLGYVIACPSIIDGLRTLQPPWSVNSLAQAAGLAALASPDYAEQTREIIAKEREYLTQALNSTGQLLVYPGAANFLLIKILAPQLSSTKLQKRLIYKGFLIRDCANFRNLGSRFFRIAIRSRPENQGLVAAIRESLSA